jgi:molecular chaperone GrpE
MPFVAPGKWGMQAGVCSFLTDLERNVANGEQPKAENEEILAEVGVPEVESALEADLTAAVEDAQSAVDEIVEAEITLEHLQDELATARDAALRAQADAQNARRRADQDVEKARKYALERFSGELLPVVDNLERALESASGDSPEIVAMTEGVELTLKSLMDVLGRFNIEQIDPQGEPFDPQFHQAMTMIENADVEPNSVLQVMQKGYTLSGRLIRPAMVLISKAPEGAK